MTIISYKFFQNNLCEFYPCHKFPHKDFNCLFCYCPLYLIEDCGGNYDILDNNIKDKSNYIEWLIYNDLLKNNKDVKKIII